MDKVAVGGFQYLHEGAIKFGFVKRPLTLIQQKAEGNRKWELIPHTTQIVDASELDDMGIYIHTDFNVRHFDS